MTLQQKWWIKRLNVLLGLACIDPWRLTDDAWNKLRDHLYWALYGDPKGGRFPGITEEATREAVKAAQEVIRREITALKFAESPRAEFHLKNQTVWLVNTAGGEFDTVFDSRDLQTMIYSMLIRLLEVSDVTRSDILICNRKTCGKFFIPLRKPSKGMKSFCAPKCANIVAAREYRKRKAEELRPKEAKRSRGRYVDKVHNDPRLRNARVDRRPKRPK